MLLIIAFLKKPKHVANSCFLKRPKQVANNCFFKQVETCC